jgi:capsular exopolysaccharide synthesis family protein
MPTAQGTQVVPAGNNTSHQAAPHRGGGAHGSGNNSTPPPVLSAGPTPLALLAAVRRRWKASLFLGVVAGTVVAGVLWYVVPKSSYTARTILHVDSKIPSILGPTPELMTEFTTYQRTQQALVKSRHVLKTALANPQVRDLPMLQDVKDPVAWLEKQITTEFTAPEFLTITVTGADPEQLKTLLSAVRDAYLAETVEKDHKIRLERLQNLRAVYEAQYKLLTDKQQALKAVVDDLGSSDAVYLLTQHQFALRQLDALQTELLGVQQQMRRAQLESQGFGDPETVEPVILEGDVQEGMNKDGEFDRRSKEVQRLAEKAAYVKANVKHWEKDEEYLQLSVQLQSAAKALGAYAQDLRPVVVQKLRDKALSALLAERDAARKRMDLLTKHEDKLRQEIESRSKQNQVVVRKTNDLGPLKSEIGGLEDNVKRVGTQIQNLLVEIQAPRRVKLQEEAVASENPSKRLPLAGLGFAAGLSLVLLGLALLEFRARKVSHPDEIVQGLRLKLLGTMPALPKAALRAPVGTPPRGRHCNPVEAIDAMRVVLQHSAGHETMQVLLVTSAFSGEGKTMLASHLALNLAGAGYRTLLIDADLRRPAVHKRFGLPAQPGLCQLLRGETTAAEVIQSGPDGLAILSAGESQGHPRLLLSGAPLEATLAALRKEYTYIVVDSAPVLPVADSQFLAKHVDGIILSVLRDVSRLPSIHAASQLLNTLQARILGAFVHGTASDAYYLSYGTYLA